MCLYLIYSILIILLFLFLILLNLGTFDGQCKSFGNVSFFVNWDTVGEVAQKLPRNVNELRVFVKYPEKSVDGADQLRRKLALKEVVLNVNPSKLRACLGWLQVHNERLYGRITRDEAVLADLERERTEAQTMTLDDVFGDWDGREQRFTTTVNMDPVGARDVGRVLRDQYGRVEITRDGGPVRPHEVPDLLAQSFPSLFPRGVGADYRHLRVPLSTAEMLEHTIRFGDPRFAQHYRYLFMMVNVKNLDMAYGSISATLKGRVKKTALDGSIEDVTEEMIGQFSKVVCRNISMLHDNCSGFREQQGPGGAASAEEHRVRFSPRYPCVLGENEESHQTYDSDEGCAYCVRDVQLGRQLLARHRTMLRFVCTNFRK